MDRAVLSAVLSVIFLFCVQSGASQCDGKVHIGKQMPGIDLGHVHAWAYEK